MFVPREPIILIKGAGDLASGVAWRLHRAGFQVVMTEIPQPTAIRRAVAFAQAVYDGETTVEGVTARCLPLTPSPEGPAGEGARPPEPPPLVGRVEALLQQGIIPVLVDPQARAVEWLHPQVVVDAIMAKRNLGTRIADAPLVIALGPGFTAGVDAHAVVETKRGHTLGRVLWEGSAAPDTGIPGEVGGYKEERVLRAPVAGLFRACKAIGDSVTQGETVAFVDNRPVQARLGGVLRGILHDGIAVRPGMKVGDVDPRGVREYCFTISDKALAVAGGVLEAICAFWRHRCL